MRGKRKASDILNQKTRKATGDACGCHLVCNLTICTMILPSPAPRPYHRARRRDGKSTAMSAERGHKEPNKVGMSWISGWNVE